MDLGAQGFLEPISQIYQGPTVLPFMCEEYQFQDSKVKHQKVANCPACLLGSSKSTWQSPGTHLQHRPHTLLHPVPPPRGSPRSLLLLKRLLKWPPHELALCHRSTHSDQNHPSDEAEMIYLLRCRLQDNSTVFPPSREGSSFLISSKSLGCSCGNILYYIIFPLHSSPSHSSFFSTLLEQLPGNPALSVAASWPQRNGVKFILHLPKSSCNLPLGKGIKPFPLHRPWLVPVLIRKRRLEQFCKYLSNADFVSSWRRDPTFLTAHIYTSL